MSTRPNTKSLIALTVHSTVTVIAASRFRGQSARRVDDPAQRTVASDVAFNGAPPTEIGPVGGVTCGCFFCLGVTRAVGAGATGDTEADGIATVGAINGDGAADACGAGLFSASIFELRLAS